MSSLAEISIEVDTYQEGPPRIGKKTSVFQNEVLMQFKPPVCEVCSISFVFDSPLVCCVVMPTVTGHVVSSSAAICQICSISCLLDSLLVSHVVTSSAATYKVMVGLYYF